MSPRTQYLIDTIPEFNKILRNLAKGILPEKKFYGYGNHPNAIQVALGATSKAPIVVPAFKGYGKPLPTFKKHTGGWNWSSNDPLVAKEYHLIDEGKLLKTLPQYSKKDQQLIMDNYDVIQKFLKKHHSKNYDFNTIYTEYAKLRGRKNKDGSPKLSEEEISDMVLKKIITGGLNRNKTYDGKLLQAWTPEEESALTTSLQNIGEIMLPSHKIEIGGMDDVIIPMKQYLRIPGAGKSYTESVINPFEFNGVKMTKPDIRGKDLNKAEEILYNAAKEGLITRKNQYGENVRPYKLFVTDIKDPQFLANSYGWFGDLAGIIRAKKGGKLRKNKWKPKQ